MQHNEDRSSSSIETWRTIYGAVSARFIHSDGQGWQIPAFGVAAQAVLIAAAAASRADVAAALAIGSMAVGTSAIFMLIDHKLAANTDQLILREIELLLLHGDESGVMTDPSTSLTPFISGSERFAAMRCKDPDRLSLRRGLVTRWSPHWWAASLIGGRPEYGRNPPFGCHGLVWPSNWWWWFSGVSSSRWVLIVVVGGVRSRT